MNRTALLLGLVSVIGALSVACSDTPPDTLSNESNESGTIVGDDDDDKASDKTTATDKTEPAKTTTTPAPTTTSADEPIVCDPKAAKTAQACTKCCAEQAAPAPIKLTDTCACGTGSKCGEECGDNLCTGSGLPSISCGLCLFEAKCDVGEVAGDLGNIATQTGTEAAACLKTCEGKPTE